MTITAVGYHTFLEAVVLYVLGLTLAVAVPLALSAYTGFIMPGQIKPWTVLIYTVLWFVAEAATIWTLFAVNAGVPVFLHVMAAISSLANSRHRLRLHYLCAVTWPAVAQKPVRLVFLRPLVGALRDAYPTVNVHLVQRNDIEHELLMEGRHIMTFSTTDKPGV